MQCISGKINRTRVPTPDPGRDEKLQLLKGVLIKNQSFGARAQTPDPGSDEKLQFF